MPLDQIESIMNDFIQLKALSNVDEAETMVEGWLALKFTPLSISLNCSILIQSASSIGTLDGFLFDSEDEGEKISKVPTDQNEPAEALNKKSKNKDEKSSVCFFLSFDIQLLMLSVEWVYDYDPEMGNVGAEAC